MANTIEVVIKQSSSGNAIADTQKALGGLGSAASGAAGGLSSFGSGLAGIATVAGGIIAADVFGRIAGGISSFVSTGLQAVGSSQQLEASLKALLTSNLMYEQSTETVTQAVTKQLMSQDEYGQKLDELNAKLNVQKATYQEQQEAIRQLTAQWGENGLAVLEAKAKHEQLAVAIRGTEQDIAGLATSETKLATTTRTTFEQTMSQAEAFKEASVQSRELLDFVSKIAVISPFETQDVETVTKFAVAAGLGVEQVKEFVPAFLDLSGAVGITSDSLGFAADQLFQVKKIGKLTEIDLRQLRRMGIDLAKVIGVEMGMSVEEFNKKAETSPEIFDDLFDAVARFSKNTFAGTAKDMATSVKGLQSTLSDIFVIGARNFMRPLVDAITPMASGLLGQLGEMVLGGRMEALGQQAAAALMSGMSKVQEMIGIFQTGGVGGLLAALGITPDALALFDKISASIGSLGSTIMSYLAPALDTIATGFLPALNSALTFLNVHFEEVKGAIIGIGAVLAAGVFAALAGAIVGLIGPVTLLLAGAALLGAAWAGNWWGIRDTTMQVWAALQPVLLELWNWLQINIPIAIQALSTFWTTILYPAILMVASFIQTTVIPMLLELWNWLSINVPLAIQTLANFWSTILLPAITAVWNFITTSVIPLLTALSTLINAVVSKAVEALAIIWESRLLPALTSVWNFIQTKVIPVFNSVANAIKTVLAPAVEIGIGKFAGLKGAIEAIPNLISKIIDKILDLADSIKSIDLGFLQPGSPSPFELSLAGINRELGVMNQLMSPLRDNLSLAASTGEAAGQVARSTTTNNYFNQTVNTRADSSSVIADFRTMQLLLGA